MGHKNNNYPSIESQQYAGSESSMEDNGEQEWVRNEQVSVMWLTHSNTHVKFF